MTITVLVPSPSGQITHGEVREKVNELVTNDTDVTNAVTAATSGWEIITGTFYDNPSVPDKTTLVAQVWSALDNPGVGAVNDRELPANIADSLYNTATQVIDLSKVNRKDEILLEISYLINVDSANTAPSFKLIFDEGLSTEFEKTVRATAVNLASVWVNDSATITFFVGDITTAKVYARCDDDAEISVKNYSIYLIR